MSFFFVLYVYSVYCVVSAVLSTIYKYIKEIYTPTTNESELQTLFISQVDEINCILCRSGRQSTSTLERARKRKIEWPAPKESYGHFENVCHKS